MACGATASKPHIRMLKGDGVTTALAEFVRLGGPERSVFFLDGDHSYTAVTRELQEIAAAAPRAVILVHDTSHPVEDTESAVEDFLSREGEAYRSDWLASQAGMVRLWPQQ